MASRWVKIPRDGRKRHPLYPIGPLVLAVMLALVGSMVANAAGIGLAARATSHIAALQITLQVYIYLQITQIGVAGLSLYNVATGRSVRRLILFALAGTTLASVLACLFMGVALGEVDLVDDAVERVGSEPFFVLGLLMDPIHPIVDLLSSYYIRRTEVATVERELTGILSFTLLLLSLRDVPLCLAALFSRPLRVRCEGEARRDGDVLPVVRWAKTLAGQMLARLGIGARRPGVIFPSRSKPPARRPSKHATPSRWTRTRRILAAAAIAVALAAIGTGVALIR